VLSKVAEKSPGVDPLDPVVPASGTVVVVVVEGETGAVVDVVVDSGTDRAIEVVGVVGGGLVVVVVALMVVVEVEVDVEGKGTVVVVVGAGDLVVPVVGGVQASNISRAI